MMTQESASLTQIYKCDVSAFMSDVDELRLTCVCAMMRLVSEWQKSFSFQLVDENEGLMGSM